MNKETLIEIGVAIFIVAIVAFLMTLSKVEGVSKERTKIHAEAIHHGYGTYDKEGKFQWVIKE